MNGSPTPEYMSPREFAALGSTAHHAVWKAAAEGKVDSIPSSPRSTIRLYRRADVEAVLADVKDGAR